jgi:argininosuccinate lyase
LQISTAQRLSEEPIAEIRELVYRASIDRMDDAGFAAMSAMNQAHLVMLVECGVLSPEAGASLARAMGQMQAEGRAGLPTDSTIEDPYFAYEARLAELVGGEIAGQLHAGRSRNDIGATLDQMAARGCCLAILAALEPLRATVLDMAARHTATIMPGHTHLQPAQPITFGFYLASIAAALQRDADRLLGAFVHIDACSLGSAAMAGTSFPIDRERTAALLGFAAVAEPCLDAVASRDFATSLLFAATQLAVTWNRVVQDLHVFFSHEFSAISLPDRVAGTSSIMPQKKNPIALEFLRAEAARAIGGLTSVLCAIKSTNFSIALDAQREGLIDLWAVLQRMPGNLRLFTRILESVTLQEALLLERCRTNFATATDLADGLVRRCGIAFRDAHHIVGGVVRLAIDQGLSADAVDAAMVERVAEPLLGRRLGVDDVFVRACLDPVRAVEGRKTQGGTSRAEVERQIGKARAALRAHAAEAAALQARVDDAADLLARRVRDVAGGVV